jgi:hypothetical protein
VVRHVKVLGLSVVAALAVAALAASPAMAMGPTPTELAEWQAFRFCPFGHSEEEVEVCFWSQSTYKEKFTKRLTKEEWEAQRERPAPNLSSEFTAGPVTVQLKNSITLQGGGTAESWIDSEGAPTIQPVRQTGPSLKTAVDTALLSPEELSRFNYTTKVSKQNKTFVTIEKAEGAPIAFNLINLLEESGTAFGFPVKVHLENPFLGNECYVGSDSEPIDVEFTTGTSGSLRGKNGSVLFTTNEGGMITIATSTLVSESFGEPGVKGCGVEGGADEAINAALNLPAPPGANRSVINGTLKAAGVSEVKAHL